MKRTRLCHGPTSRRSLLKAGSLLLGGLGLPDLLRLRSAAGARQRADTAVILLWLEGGPSHMETYDMKPQAPQEYRGEFSPIKTNVSGMDVCELLPRHCQLADRMSLVRSIAHQVSDHPGAAGRFLTGRTPRNVSALISEYPTFDSIVGSLREPTSRSGIPQFVSNRAQLKGGGTAYLGPTAGPFVVEFLPPHIAQLPIGPDFDPLDAQFEVANIALEEQVATRLDDRMRMLRSFDQLRRDVDANQQIAASDRFHQRAVQLLSSTATRDAFDLTQESDRLRDRYGRNTLGQSALLARRLVESGCSMITLDWGRVSRKYPTWDDHGDAHHIFKAMKSRLPIYDQALTALIEDVYQRGLDQQVLIIATGEFGRTPKVNMGRAKTPIWPGRDHWPGAMSLLVSGGGWNMGQVIGQTNQQGEYPVERPLDPNDFVATVYRFLGINPEAMILDRRGRPLPLLPSGEPIRELS
ncbi:MAG: DUF1501 domain-containing protein [Pirellulaceae bacterium]|nr:DUF1501 domain-containing protein [Pirellulaceae bacterium]